MSRYAILQTSLEVPDAEAVRRAFTRVSFLTAADASIVLRDAYGILFRNLSYEDAISVHEALAAEGVAVDVVEHRHLPELPTTKFVKRVELRPDELVIYDPLGRKFGLEWGHFALVSAGLVPVEEEKEFTTVAHGLNSSFIGGSDLDDLLIEASTQFWTSTVDSGREPERVVTSRKNVTVEKRFIDLVLTRGVARYTLEADEVLLGHVLGRPCGRELPNAFLELIRRIVSHAGHASLNRGALVARDQGALMAYPSRNAFHEETQWHLWQMRRRTEDLSPPG